MPFKKSMASMLKDDSSAIRSHRRYVTQLPPFAQRGPGVAVRLQLCGIRVYCASACVHLQEEKTPFFFTSRNSRQALLLVGSVNVKACECLNRVIRI
ncbi:hypothetical protein NQZ68_023111 [Dissostichus eleginoides]|nr:hypothetical protein NQZ68_023111 [Dissostichus eleginoides]